ncbi:MAG: hypothetical protein II886_06620 [Prevotella sp.]|nr:hypothetical protein [Prevotella sp.]
MGKALKWIVGTVVALVAVIVLLLVGAFAMLNTSWLQGKLLTKATTLLTEKLETKVEIDSVSIDLLTLDAKLYGLMVEDRQQRKMLQLEFLQADVDVLALLDDEIRVAKAKVEGIQAELHKLPKDSLSPDTVANYQFVIDAFKSDKKKAKKAVPDSADVKKNKLAFVMNKVSAERIDVRFNNDSVGLDKLVLEQTRSGSPQGKIEGVRAKWERYNKKGYLVTNTVLLTRLDYHEEEGNRMIDIHRLNFKTNNHHPRKNASKPKRGFFDVGHFNLWANLKVTIDRIENGTVHGWLKEFTAQDTISGIDITKLQCEVTANKEGMRMEDVVIKQKNTELHFVRGDMKFPNKKQGTKLSYFTSTIGGRVILKDISKAFAPVLRNFELPLDLSVRMDGDAEGMRFHDVVVSRPNDLLKIKAKGYITGLKNKYDLKVHFDVKETVVKGNEKERIINQFVVKKFMMKQLHALGTLHYRGSFDVVYKREEFQGVVNTKAGDINFFFALDEKNKYLLGRANAVNIKLGEVMDMPDIGPVTATANFKFDISKPRTALMRRKLGGKLPIGEVTANVAEASYKFVKATNVDVKIVSNGAIAEGSLKAPGKFADLSCTFSFTNTNEMKKTKIKPGIRFHIFDKKKTTDEEKAAKQQQKVDEKQRKADEKAAKKAAKAEAKAARKAAKEAEKAAEAKEKAARKAAEAEEKAAKKAAKAEAKAARKAAKEAEKAAKRAAKESQQ